MKKPKPIGIVGGAGPSAGVIFVDQIFRLAKDLYGCHKDADFPKVFLLSFPFSDMLSLEIDHSQIKQELKECLTQLRNNGAEVLSIACNTLHAFLDEKENLTDLVHLPQMITTAIPPTDIPFVLCTSTSLKFGIHKKFFNCTYPDLKTQHLIDRMIDQILKKNDTQSIVQELINLIQTRKENTIILGCTEFSLLTDQLFQSEKTIIDPLTIAAKKILERSFSSPLSH
jgi:aspartate racemase